MEKVPNPVYVIDDDGDVRKALKVFLDAFGWSARCFSGANEFLTILPALRPACLVVDIRMPEKDGLTLVEEMRTGGFNWPIIFVTGHTDEIPASKSICLIGCELVRKPFVGTELLDALVRQNERVPTS